MKTLLGFVLTQRSHETQCRRGKQLGEMNMPPRLFIFAAKECDTAAEVPTFYNVIQYGAA